VPVEAPSTRQRVGQYVAFAAICAYAAVQFLGADPRPWGLAAVWAAATAVALGPIAWLARDRLPPDRLGTATYVAVGAAILAVPVGLGIALAFEVPFFPYGPGFLAGVAFGATLVLVAERAVVPERLRGMAV
jgi:CHASE2 domain-containing sensor protein